MAIVGARLMFQVGSRTITGNLSGKFLHCTVRPAQGGALPPAGDYEILPPVSDPIYGRLAVMAPAGGLGATKDVDKSTPAVRGKLIVKPYAAPPVVAMKFETPGAGGGPVFVLSDRPVLGRNCIVVGSGFADLMDALQTAGGARVRVA
jgi:hypothetical protein